MVGTTLLIRDTHCVLPDFSGVKKYFGKVDVIISLGDLVDELKNYSMRELFLKELSSKFKELSDNVFVVKGNHEAKCIEYEKKYMALNNGEVSSLRSLREPTKEEEALLAVDRPLGSVVSTDKLLEGLGVVSDYVCVNEEGRMFKGDDLEDFLEVCEGDYELYVAKPNRVPKLLFFTGNPRVTLVSHRQNTRLFKQNYLHYFHAHRHDLYQNGHMISSSVFKSPAKNRWKVYRSFYYDLEEGKLGRSSRHTPSISFFLDDRYKTARLELIPGICGDWMVLDSEGRRVVYGSSITGKATEIPIDGLFEKLCEKVGIEGY